MDLTATQIVEITQLNRNTVNRVVGLIRLRMAQLFIVIRSDRALWGATVSFVLKQIDYSKFLFFCFPIGGESVLSLLSIALVVQWIERWLPKLAIRVKRPASIL